MKQSEWKLWAFVVFVVVLVSVFAYKNAPAYFEKIEVGECLKLKGYSEQFVDIFYLTDKESAMCESHGIYINAPVGDPYDEKNN